MFLKSLGKELNNLPWNHQLIVGSFMETTSVQRLLNRGDWQFFKILIVFEKLELMILWFWNNFKLELAVLYKNLS